MSIFIIVKNFKRNRRTSYFASCFRGFSPQATGWTVAMFRQNDLSCCQVPWCYCMLRRQKEPCRKRPRRVHATEAHLPRIYFQHPVYPVKVPPLTYQQMNRCRPYHIPTTMQKKMGIILSSAFKTRKSQVRQHLNKYERSFI